MHKFVCALAVMLAVPGLLSPVVWADEPVKQANSSATLATEYLFQRAHLGKIMDPAVLRYKFERRAEPADSFTDVIDLKVENIRDDGRRDTSFEFFTGPRSRPYPAMSDFFGNPLVIVFLQRDVWALSRARGGQARYFTYRIRQALREAAKVEKKTIQTDLGAIAVHSITIAPYKDDRYRRKLGQFEFKTYEFVVSQQVPGEIYMIRTLVPSADKTAPMIEETVTFENLRKFPGGTTEQ